MSATHPSALVHMTQATRLHHPHAHAAARTDEYVFSQLIPYIGNKRKLLHLIAEAVEHTGGARGDFVDLFAGSTVVSRWAKKAGFRVLANDWEPYAAQIARGTVALNRPPAFTRLGGAERVIAALNALPPVDGYVTTHLCPRNDERPDTRRERMFFTRENGQRIDAIGEQIAAWHAAGQIGDDERAYLLAPFIYAVSYASNTSGVFKGFHRGWGGRTATALYRIRGTLRLQAPVLFDNQRANLALREDAQRLAGELPAVCGRVPDIVYIDPPYNQHPYGSNYHVLNTIALWDKPPVARSILVNGRVRDKSAIRRDWRTERRSPYNFAAEALGAFRELIGRIRARWVLVSYSTDGNIPLEGLLAALAERGPVRVFAERYKRYRVSTPRMSPRSHNVEFVAVLKPGSRRSTRSVGAIVEALRQGEGAATAR